MQVHLPASVAICKCLLHWTPNAALHDSQQVTDHSWTAQAPSFSRTSNPQSHTSQEAFPCKLFITPFLDSIAVAPSGGQH